MTTSTDAVRQDGFALIIVLWILGLLMLLIAALAANGRNDVGSAAGMRANAIVQAAADGAISSAIFQVIAGTWATNSTEHLVSIGPVSVSIAIEDQGGRIDPNFSSPPLLAALLVSVGVEPGRAASLARRIADWHTPMPFSLDGGPKLQFYRDVGLGYGPPDSPFRSADEIGLVPGMSQDTLDRLRPFISVYQGADPRTANGQATNQLPAGVIGVGAADIMTSPIATADRVLEIRAAAHMEGQARFVRRALVRLMDQPKAEGRLWQILGWERAPSATRS